MKRFSPKQSKRIGIGLVWGAVLMGAYALVAAWPPGFVGLPTRAAHPPLLAAEEDARPAEATSPLTPEEMEHFIASKGQADSGQDPFLSSGEQEWKRFLSELRDRPPRLQGIIRTKNARVALIQNSRFREGDEVRGFRIVRIEDKRVFLTKGGKIYTVPLAQE